MALNQSLKNLMEKMNKDKFWGRYALIASFAVCLFIADKVLWMFQNYELRAMLDWHWWLLLAIEVGPLLILTLPLFYFGFRKNKKE